MNTDSNNRLSLTGVALAGGMGRRMGGQDKGLILLAGRPMIEYVLDALRDQVDSLIISANRNQEVYAAYGVPVVSDDIGNYFGPLAGMTSAMNVAPAGLLLTAPCDSPLVAKDYASRMRQALVENRAEIAVAHDGERLQPVFALLLTSLRQDLIGFLESGERKIDRWYSRHRMVEVDFSDRAEMFLNVNRPEDREALEMRLG
ncbi:MAG: molybdenum cofactor guanylyltransferase [Proteobacteria bacterium]|nr:MAG: molybdenum cofactor guanylyltransferase [Pseudomonadota bacterium]